MNTNGALDRHGPFFQSLGTNGRACVSCHQPAEGWTITPSGVSRRFDATHGLDPIFRTNDGSNCENADVSTPAKRRQAFSLLLGRGLIRIAIDVPANAEFEIVNVDDPYGCHAGLTSASMYRRPLPSTNLRFLSAIMWDGREPDLKTQANDATLGHAQASLAPTTAELQQIVDLESGLFTAQARDDGAGGLQAAGGGPIELSREPFFIGINDPLGLNPTGAPFDPNAFTLFDAWSGLRDAAHDPVVAARLAIARGQQIFNTKRIDIVGVSGLNDELHVASIPGTCTTCHDTPNVGNHSVKAPLNIGVADASRRAGLPLYTLMNLATGETTQTTDPGRAMISGKWKDIGRFKGPILRGLAARAPYFHNGFAATLEDVVNFYDTRFGIGLTAQDKADLVAFLRAL